MEKRAEEPRKAAKRGSGSMNLLNFVNSAISAENQYLLMRQADRHLGLGIQNIREIIRAVKINPIPESIEDTIGVINYRGRVIPVIGLWNILEQKPPEVVPEMGVVIIELGDSLFGLLMEDVLGVQTLEVEPRPDDLREDVLWPMISGVAYEQDLRKMTLILNPERLRRSPSLDYEYSEDGEMKRKE